jgi:hypothetical protein
MCTPRLPNVTVQTCATYNGNGDCTGYYIQTSDGQRFTCSTCSDQSECLHALEQYCGGLVEGGVVGDLC